MQPNITRRVERHLDQQLGVWTRLLPWRRELAAHLEEAYEARESKAAQAGNGETAWQEALADFGSVQETACQLRREHWPQYIGWRFIAIVAALAVVFSISKPWALVDLPALSFSWLPIVAFVVYDTFRGSTRWALVNRIGIGGCVCGAMAGVVVILTDFDNPSTLGAGMALSILSALYCVLFFTPRRSVVAALVGISLLDFVLMLFAMHAASAVLSVGSYSPQFASVDRAFLMRMLALLLAGFTIGIARFGFYGLARHASSVGAGIFLLSLVMLLGDMSDPSRIAGDLLVGLGAMGLAIALSHCASDSSRLIIRLLR